MNFKNIDIPFIHQLNIDHDKIIDALLLPVNLSKISIQTYSILAEGAISEKRESEYANLVKLHNDCYEAKCMSVNQHAQLYNNIHQSSLIEYKALDFMTQKFSAQEILDLMDNYSNKANNENNGVVFQNHYKNLSFLLSSIGEERFPDIIKKMHLNTVNDDYNSSKFFPTKHKIQINFICDILENVDNTTIKSSKSFTSLKSQIIMNRMNEQKSEIDKDLQYLHDKGYTNVKKEDLRANLAINQMERNLKIYSNIKESINCHINFNKTQSLIKAIDNSELSGYINSLEKYKFTDNLVGTIIDGYKLSNDRFVPEMEYRQEEKAHEEYQVLSIIKNDNRRKDLDFQEKIKDGSLFVYSEKKKSLFFN